MPPLFLTVCAVVSVALIAFALWLADPAIYTRARIRLRARRRKGWLIRG
jgi:hypothetical protein